MSLDYWRNENKDIYLSWKGTVSLPEYFFQVDRGSMGFEIYKVTRDDLENLRRSLDVVLS